jgi:hypothetical protein
VFQAGFQLLTLQHQPLKCWDYRLVPAWLAFFFFFWGRVSLRSPGCLGLTVHPRTWSPKDWDYPMRCTSTPSRPIFNVKVESSLSGGADPVCKRKASEGQEWAHNPWGQGPVTPGTALVAECHGSLTFTLRLVHKFAWKGLGSHCFSCSLTVWCCWNQWALGRTSVLIPKWGVTRLTTAVPPLLLSAPQDCNQIKSRKGLWNPTD